MSCVGIAGTVTTTVFAVKATTRASRLLQKAEEEKGNELETAEKIKIAVPVYIPTALALTGTVACILGANILNKRSQASLMSAYALIDGSFKQYKGKLKELYGEETHQNVVDAIVKEECKDIQVNAGCMGLPCNLEADSDDEIHLFYDLNGQRYFESTLAKVVTAEYHLNRNFVLRGYVVLNELYDFLGLEPTDFGSELGWAVEDEFYWIDFNHRKVIMDDGLECYVIESYYEPSLEWKEYYY